MYTLTISEYQLANNNQQITNYKVMKKVFLFAITALLFVACQKENSEQVASGEGRIAITASASGEVITRADGVQVATPQLSDFSLLITGKNFEKSWNKLTDYRTDDERYTAGTYTVAIACGDSTQEGYNVPAFAASESVEVLDRNRTTEANLTAKLSNAIVTIKTTDAFNRYFPVSEFKVTTTSNSFDFDFDRVQTDHLYIAAGQDIKIDCSCIRQSNLSAGTVEKLATQTLSNIAPTTRYVVTYDLTTVGGVKITVKLNEEILGTIEVETELNPNA
jgi:hypothetical protein